MMNGIDKSESILSGNIASLGFWIAIMESMILNFNLYPGNQLYTELDINPFGGPLEENKQIK